MSHVSRLNPVPCVLVALSCPVDHDCHDDDDHVDHDIYGKHDDRLNHGDFDDYGQHGEPKRQCQIRVRFESGVKTKFLAALNQLLTSFFQCHNLPWSHSFQKIYDMYIVKMNG